jgi:quinohemoprotein amine dehydrogenase
MTRIAILTGAVLALALAGTAPPAMSDEALLADKCGSCHTATDAGLSRIAGQRKTPEGWLMTIVRMRQVHGVEITNDEQAKLVMYLSETRGVAPSEAANFRYALERDPSAIETTEEPLGSMCGRCHTFARAGLQRRTPDEWLLHMHFHVGQFPTTEYQALGRDRDWFQLSVDEIAPMLATTYSFETDEWTAWQAAEKPQATGDWLVLTTLPGKGDAYGRLTIGGNASPYDLTGELRLADGTALAVSGSMNFYTGYEWRANLDIGGDAYRQVLAISEDGTSLAGRQFLRETDSLGGALTGVRAGSGPTILGIVPPNARGGSATVQVVGTGLDGLSAEGAALGAVEPNDFGASAELSAEADALVSLRADEAESTFAFYTGADRVVVEPAFTIARVGGGSNVGPLPVPAEFRAVAFWNGPDGMPGTDDDIRIGVVPAKWSVAGAHDAAVQMEDAKYAGTMGPDGIFMPALAGPNPERPFSTNNAGDLTITADALGKTGTARLIVTVQRFVDPPIR